MTGEEVLANLTHYQNIGEAILTTMGESMALQQALLHVPSYDGTNMPLEIFIQDIKKGYAVVPDGIKETYIKTVCTKLKNVAGDAATDRDIETIEGLTNAFKEYFDQKKSYPHYCAEIQGVRLARDESVLNYYNRIKRIRAKAINSFKEHFIQVEIEVEIDGVNITY